MIRRAFSRVRVRHLTLWIVALGCLSDSTSYSPEQDTEAFMAIESTWVAGVSNDITIIVCEDMAAPEVTNDCQVEHTVRGDGRGMRHEASHGGGCGGCPFGNVAYVTGKLTVPGLAPNTPVHGEVHLGADGDDPYALPYNIHLSCDDVAQPCSFQGTIEADGSLRGFSSVAGNPAGPEIRLTRQGSPPC